jgi:hypothetical protein
VCQKHQHHSESRQTTVKTARRECEKPSFEYWRSSFSRNLQTEEINECAFLGGDGSVSAGHLMNQA